ncbi:MAG: hypothetical protein Q8Q90_03760 [bacterium]|nr:hypothetical protein [bacterium]
MSEGEPHNQEVEKPLEELTDEKLIEIMENENMKEFERIRRTLDQIELIGDSASTARSALDHFIQEANHRSSGYDWPIGELDNIKEIVKKLCPDGKIMF